MSETDSTTSPADPQPDAVPVAAGDTTADATPSTALPGDAPTEPTANLRNQADPIAEVLGSARWLDYVPAEHCRSASKYKSFGEFVRAHGDLTGKLGTALFPPGPDAAPEELARFHERLGRPAGADGYVVPEIEGVPLDGDAVAAFRQRAFAAGLNQQQFDELVLSEVEHGLEAQRQLQTAHAQAHAALTEQWGAAAPGNYEMARRVSQQLATAEQRQQLGLADDPKQWPAVLVEILAGLAPSFADDRHIGRSSRDLGRSDAALLREFDDLEAAPDYARNEAKQRRAREIMETLYGTGAIASAPG